MALRSKGDAILLTIDDKIIPVFLKCGLQVAQIGAGFSFGGAIRTIFSPASHFG